MRRLFNLNEIFLLKTRLELYYEKTKANEFRMKTECTYTVHVIFLKFYTQKEKE